MAIAISQRRYVIGVAVVVVFLFAPIALRVLTGSQHVRASELAFFAAMIVAAPGALTAGLRLGDRRNLSLARTIAIGYGLAAATGAALAVAWQLVADFDPGATYLEETAKGAYFGMVMVGIWGMFMVMPRAIRAERDRAELRREAERSRVRAALEPHFVLNTLNAIGGLIGEDPDTARELVGDLGDLLRDVVDMAEREVQPAAAEIAWLQRYARILEARHAGRLVVEWSVDPAAAAIDVPVLLLQPLLENAIQHGALQRPGGGRVRVEIRLASRSSAERRPLRSMTRGRELRCTIEDDGPGMSVAQRDGARGLALTRRRLACDAPGSMLEIDSAPTGTRAIVHLAIDGERSHTTAAVANA
jgi:signal transduction histidine kinase